MRPRHWPVALLLFFTTCVSSALAEIVRPHFDFDSLVVQSDAIIQARIRTSVPWKTVDGDCTIFTVEVLKAVKGPPKVGDLIKVAGLDVYHRAPGITGVPDSWEPLQKGDVVYLFLTSTGVNSGQASYRLTDAKWDVISSGVRLVVGDEVYAFGQHFPNMSRSERPPEPHGLVAMTGKTFPHASIVTEQILIKRLSHTKALVADVNQLVAAPASPENTRRIIALIRERSKSIQSEDINADLIDRKLVGKLNQVADPGDLFALRAVVPWSVQIDLNEGLQGPRGRPYLLEHVADPKEDAAVRLNMAEVLSGAGWSYQSEVSTAKPGQVNLASFDFATQLARVAVENLRTELSEWLLLGLADIAPKDHAATGPLADDLAGAAKVLATAFPASSPRDQFALAETLMQISPDRYRQVLPHAGQFLTLVEPSPGYAFTDRKLYLECCFRNQLSVATKFKLVLRPCDGTADMEIPLNTPFGDATETFGRAYQVTAVIPASVAGKQLVFLRDFLDSRPNGDGIGFTSMIPRK